MVDKRRHKRVKVKLNLVVSNIFDQNADMIKIDSPIEVKDVSRSGIGFITKSILPMNYFLMPHLLLTMRTPSFTALLKLSVVKR